MTSSASKIDMAGADRPPRPRIRLGLPAASVGLALAAFGLIGGTSCTPALPPPQTPPKKPEPAPAAAPAEPTAGAPATAPAEPAPGHDATLIVIDPGDPDAGGRPSLVEASKREKERKAKAGKPVAVITNETLPKLAKKGQLTFADMSKTAEKPPASDLASVEQEKYWSGRARAIRQRWRDAIDEGVDLERQAADLRRKFYAEADPFRRDGEIKPSWDRTLDRLRLAKERAEGAKKELGEFLEEGRRAGALPGWLREGAELEPEAPAPPKTSAEAIEPPILKPKDEK